MREKYIFISYKSDEKQHAIEVKLMLQTNGIHGWIDESEIMAGDNYAERIDEAVRNSSAVLLIMSNKALGSAHVRSELTLAMKYARPIYAYIIEDCNPGEEFNFDLPAEKRCKAFENKDRAMSNMISYLKSEIEADNSDPYDVAEFLKKRRRRFKEKKENRSTLNELLKNKIKGKVNVDKERTEERKLYKMFPLNLTPYARPYSRDKYVRFALNIHTVLVVAMSIGAAVMISSLPTTIAWILGVIFALLSFVVGENIVGLFSWLIAKTRSRVKISLLSIITLYVSFWTILFVFAIITSCIRR